MQNYEQILQELGIEVPEDKKADLKKKMGENYKTIADYNKVVEKRDEFERSLADVQGKLDGFKDVNVDDLKGQIATLTTQLAEEKAGRQADATRQERLTVLEDFLKDKKFVNSITEKSIKDSIMAELEKNNGKSVEKIFDSLTKDKDGNLIDNILVDEKQEQLEANRAKIWTAPAKPTNGATIGAMTREQIEAIPNKAERQRAIAEHISLFK